MTSFPSPRRAITLLLTAAVVLTAAGCSSLPSTVSNGEAPVAETATSSQVGAGKGPACEDNTSGVEIFAGEGVTNAPEPGQVWGDGSELAFDYADFVPGATLGYEIGYVQENGSVSPVTGGFFAEPSGTTFASSDLYFDSTSEGYFGIVSVTMTSNVEFDGENYTSDSTDVANFCVLLATSE